jgi:hypothetical protein
MVTIPNPPPDRSNTSPSYVPLPFGTTVLRVLRKEDEQTYLRRFRDVLVQCRFDHHEPNIADRAVMYAAYTLSCCLVEAFDTRVIERERYCVAAMTFDRELKLLDIRGSAAMRLECVHAISGITDRAITQGWSRHWYEYFPEIDGLLYTSAHNGEDAIVLYERCEQAMIAFEVSGLGDLDWEADIQATVLDNNMRIAESSTFNLP